MKKIFAIFLSFSLTGSPLLSYGEAPKPNANMESASKNNGQGDASRGKRIFIRCIACHFADREQNKIGPSLLNILGRKAGSKANYSYSAAMIKAGQNGLVWNKETLTTYLHAPHQLVPGTKMIAVNLAKDSDIADLIAYLGSQEKK